MPGREGKYQSKKQEFSSRTDGRIKGADSFCGE